MSTRRPGQGLDAHGGAAGPEPWLWSAESPEAAARFAALLTRRTRVVECVSSGGSMGETLPDGTRLRFDSGRREARPGDVVVVLAGPTELIVHRVVGRGWGRRGRGYVITRGDGSLLCDQPLRADAVLGSVEECLRAGRWVPVGPCPPRPRGAALMTWTQLALTRAALAISPRLAAGLTARSYGLLTRIRALRLEG